MYEGFYGLKADPFRLSADHRFCFQHRSYARAKAYVQYALHRAEGFVLVTGRPGTGKTTLVNDLLATLPNREFVARTLVSTQLEAKDLLLMVGHIFGLDFHSTEKALVLQRLMEFLSQQHRQGIRTLLIIDEAQDLAPSALEELRLLTNLQRNGEPLLQIALLGQDSLLEMVRLPAMEQLLQRTIAAWSLEPLDLEETIGYVRHRLEQAGWTGDPSFEPGVMRVVHQFSGGVPRWINLICSRLLLHGLIGERHTLTIDDARNMANDLLRERLARPDFDPEEAPYGVATARSGSPRHDEGTAASADIDRGLFGPVQTDGAAGGDATELAPRAPEEGFQIRLEPEGPASARPSAGQVPPAVAWASDAATPPQPLVDEGSVQTAGEREMPWDNLRDEQGADATGVTAAGRKPRRLSWIILLAIIWVGLAVLFVSRETLETAPIAGFVQWWGEVAAAVRDRARAATEAFPQRDRPAASAEDSAVTESPPEAAASAALAAPVPPATETETAPETIPAMLAPGPGAILIEGQVFFRVNDTAVDPAFEPLLEEIAEALKTVDDAYAEIIGYTDRFGDPDYNRLLSRQRAQSVANRLVTRGITMDRLRIDGQGPLQPDPEAALRREEERMVEITVRTPPG